MIDGMWLRLAGMVLMAVGLTTSAAIRVVRAQSFATDIVQMPSPAGPGRAQPQLTVSARGVLLSWIERSGDVASLKFSELRGQARGSPPRAMKATRMWRPRRIVASPSARRFDSMT